MELVASSGASRLLLDARLIGDSLRLWPARCWVAAAIATGVAGLVMGVPTGIVRTDFYTRMTPVTWWDYPMWGLSALLIGVTAATYVRVSSSGSLAPDRTKRTAAMTLLTTFAVGCPICNKLVVAVIGVSGTLSYWAPLQPLLGIASIALLLTGFVVRLRGARLCPLPRVP